MSMNCPREWKGRERFLLAGFVAFFWAYAHASSAGEPDSWSRAERKSLEVPCGKSAILEVPVRRVSSGNPDIAEVKFFPPQHIYVVANKPGTTNLTLWHLDGNIEIYDIEVSYDVVALKRKLHEILPQEAEIKVVATDDGLTLAGRVSSASNLSQALAVAEGFAPKEKIRNLLEVGGIHQVMLEVRVSEISRSLLKKLGVNFVYTKGGDFGIGLPGKLADVVKPDEATLSSGPLGIITSSAVNTLFRFHSGEANWTGLIDALREEGLVKVLAEPTLIALSGQEARFLVGGEFPVPVPQGLGTVAIQYKPFGVGLSFTPNVLSEKKISITVVPEVSELDFSNALQFQGFVVPGITTRRASTVVELSDGQCFAIAGLLKDSVRDSISKYPFLGDVPILGNLFRSRSFQKNETELVIIVTPHLVKPLDERMQSLPTDHYVEPDDVDYYIWGTREGREAYKVHSGRAQVDGDFGHSIPVGE